MCRTRENAFSLIEVVIAIGLVAGGMAVILALLPTMIRNSSDAKDMQTALRLPDAVRSQLITDAKSNFNEFATGIPLTGRMYVAERDGTNVRAVANADAEYPVRGQYFLITVQKFAAAPLAYVSGSSFLALQVEVSWPYRVLAATELTSATGVSDRQSISFNLGLNQ